MLRKRSYVSGIVFTLVFFGSIVGFSLTTGLFLQIGLGFTAMHASLYLAAMAVGAFFGAGVGAWASTAVGRPILHVGLAIMAGGSALLYLSLRGADGGVGFGSLAPGLFVFGLGMGMIFVPLFSIIMGEIDDHEVGSAAGLLESLQQLGASLGVAALGTLFFDGMALEDGGPAGRDGRRTAPGRGRAHAARSDRRDRVRLGDRLAAAPQGARDVLTIPGGRAVTPAPGSCRGLGPTAAPLLRGPCGGGRGRVRARPDGAACTHRAQ